MTNETTVHVAVYDGWADWEVGHAISHINDGEWQRDPGAARVVAVGETAAPVTTMGGLRITPELVLPDLSPGASSMLLLPGASSWLTGANMAFVDAARAFLDDGVPVAAICGATVGLAIGGVLDDRAHTSNAKVVLESVGYGGGEHYREVPAVTDGDLITASAMAPVPFAREVLARLGLHHPAVLDAWFRLYGEGDPGAYDDLVAASAA